MNNILFLVILSLFINSIFAYNIHFIRLLCPQNKYIHFNSYLYTKTILDKKKYHDINNRKNRTKINNFKLIQYINKNDYLNIENSNTSCSEN